jgi:hypothetical protein
MVSPRLVGGLHTIIYWHLCTRALIHTIPPTCKPPL